MDANFELKKENSLMMSKIEEVANIEKTVKYLSKKVLDYSKYKVQLENMRNADSKAG
jgi:hypothetical protein